MPRHSTPKLFANVARHSQREPSPRRPSQRNRPERHRRFSAVRRTALIVFAMLAVAALGSSTAHAAIYSEQSVRWPQGAVYYQIDSSLPDAYKIATRKAVAQFNAHQSRTGVWIFARTNEADYVKILPTWSGPSRVSHVGYQGGGVQYMYLNVNLPPMWQVVVHEFGHVLGLHHEHQRCERDIWLDVPNPGGAMTKQCGLPTAERYNPLSIMHYSDSELDAFGVSFRKPENSAPAKSLHPGLVESDLRTIATMYRSSGTFSTVSVMHGKCLTAPDLSDGARVRIHRCEPTRGDQKWVYDAATGEFKVDAKCLGVSAALRESPVVIAACNGGQQQKWDFGKHGGLLLRSIKDPEGRPLCAEILHWSRTDGTELMVQYCHRGDNQQWRRNPAGWNVGPSTVSIVSDVIPANVTEGPQPSKCMNAASGDTGTAVLMAECGNQFTTNQRFVRTAEREIRIHGKCVDGHGGQVGDPVRLWDCNSAPNQRWELTATGTLYGINGLCIEIAGGSNANGAPLRLAACNPNAAIRWSTRDP